VYTTKGIKNLNYINYRNQLVFDWFKT